MEEKLKSKVKIFKKEVLSLQVRNSELRTKILNIIPQPIDINNETSEIKEARHENHLNFNMSLETLIKRNSFFFC